VHEPPRGMTTATVVEHMAGRKGEINTISPQIPIPPVMLSISSFHPSVFLFSGVGVGVGVGREGMQPRLY
jgi:hypothetical protein